MRPRIGAVVLVTLGLLMAGCSPDDTDGPDDTATPMDTASASASATGPSSGSSSESGSPTDLPSASGELPAKFPVDAVPLVEGEIGEVLENPGLNSYLVKIYPDTDFATAFEAASTALTGAGFEQGPDVISAGPTSSTADFTSEDWSVVITGGVPGRTLVQYTIYPAE